MVYILQHTITGEILGVFDNKEFAEKWESIINYSKLTAHQIQTPENNL